MEWRAMPRRPALSVFLKGNEILAFRVHATGSHILHPALECQEGTDLADVSLGYWNRDKPFLDLQQDRTAGLRELRTLAGG